ncbi:zinc finger protein 83-like [Wyeomyia smithii]|uniref:zinc finger protein 83-like n=1 Tax=Wyeomyia smithii TaxID=174621 RepID=UPI002467FD78|nr:zinc finger protein 83-like [Wyeomyia smithii]
MDFSSDTDQICRLCCESKLRLNDITLLEYNQKCLLMQFFAEVLRLEYDPDDGLPQKICKHCITTVANINETIEDIRANDAMLRKRFCDEIKLEKVEMVGPTETLIPIETEETNDETYAEPLNNVEYLDQDEHVLQSYLSGKTEQTDEDHSETILAESLKLPSEDEFEPQPESESEQSLLQEKPCATRKKDNTKTNRKQPRVPARRGRKPGPKMDTSNRPRLNDNKCYVCKSDSLGSKEALLAHLHSHSDMLPYTCKICVKEYIVIDSVTTLNVHKRMHENPVKCNYCDRRYSDKRNVALHVQQFHLGETTPCPFPCNQCGKVCSSKMSLKLHQVLHNKPFKCDRCEKVFSQKSKLRRHIERRHERTKQYECHICHKLLHSLDAVQQHIENMHTEKSLICSYCSKKFSSKTLLRNHENVHKRNPEYRAPQSWTSFYTPLEGENEGYSKCHVCNMKFKSIVAHLRQIHFPEEYHCQTCGAIFKRKEAYETHVLEHVQGKAFQCPICGREFSERKLLVCHLRTKKHKDHPLAKSLDWLARKRQNTRHKSEEQDSDLLDDVLV